MIWLGAAAHGHDNNLNVIRMVAASAVLVSLLLVSFVLGPLTTGLPLAKYLTARGTWMAVYSNLTLYSPQYWLPGVFNDNPFPAVQGSIWTLIHEVLCYVMVFLAGLAGAFRQAWRFWVFLALYAAYWGVSLISPDTINPRIILLRDLSLPFVCGMVAWVWRDRLPLSVWGVVALVLVAAALRDTALAYPALVAALFYGTFWLAYVPGGALRAYNRLGDYSYGMYIYAFPLQGLVVWLWHPATPLAHIALALPLTLVAAVLSWHWVERPALAVLRRMP